MISALVLPFALWHWGLPVPEPSPAGAAHEPAVRIWLSDDGRYRRGDDAKVQVRARDDGYLLVLHVDPDRRLRVLFPIDPEDDNFVRGGRKYEVVGRGDRTSFRADEAGRGTIYAAVSRDPFRFDGFVTGDHWDFRALNDVSIGSDVEADLNEFVRRLATRDFDYDIVGYEVYERSYATTATKYVVAEYWAPGYYPSYWYDPWCFGWRCSRSFISIGLTFGSPFYYDPFFHDPFFYDPFFCCRYSLYRYHRHRPFFRHPVLFHPGVHFATPWRRRWAEKFGPGDFIWRDRGGVMHAPGRLAAARVDDWRDRRVEAPVGAIATAYNTVPSRRREATVERREATMERVDVAPRRGVDAGLPNVTPRRRDETPAPVVRRDDAATPAARPAQPRRAEPSPSAEPRRMAEPRRVDEPSRTAERRPTFEPRRVPEVRGPEARGLEPRRAPEVRAPEPHRAPEARVSEPRRMTAPPSRPAPEVHRAPTRPAPPRVSAPPARSGGSASGAGAPGRGGGRRRP